MSLSPRAVLLDLDGVLYVEDEPVRGAVQAVERMRAAGLTLRFVTNTTSQSRAATLEKLSALGFERGERGADHTRAAGPPALSRARPPASSTARSANCWLGLS